MSLRDEQCGKKFKFDSLRQAVKVMRTMRSREGMRPYLCPHCHAFHIGNTLRQRSDSTLKPVKRWHYNHNEEFE